MADGTGTTIGKAYVQIMPSTEGMKANLTQAMGGEAESAGASAGNSFASKFKSFMIKAGIATAFTTVLKSALDEGAKLQQSYMGGVETIYGTAADSVRTFAKQASSYGMSMNDYSEQAVSFGASLKQAYGGDAVKAANAANTAIMDMSDNQAKMGTDISSIQDAYQGFAKQNYTMLDNLKLGYGGTKTEMERLLSDAEKISGVHYDISNLGDVYSAIHVIQGSLGLTGVAAEEASTTFSGSFDAMKASAENFMGSLALGENIQPALTQLLSSVNTFINGNLIPLLGTIGSSIITALPDIMSGIGTLISSMIKGFISHVPDFVNAGGQLIDAVIKGITGKDSSFGSTIAKIVNSGLKTIKLWGPAVAVVAGAFVTLKKAATISTTINNVSKSIGGISTAIGAISTGSITTAFAGLKTSLLGLKTAVSGLFTSLMANPAVLVVAGIAAVAVALVALYNNSETFRNFVNELWVNIQAIFSQVMTTLQPVFTAVSTFFTNIWTQIQAFVAWVTPIIQTVITNIISGVQSLLTMCQPVIDAIVLAFQNAFDMISAIWDFLVPVFQGIWNGIVAVWDAVSPYFQALYNTLVAIFTPVAETLGSFFSTAWTVIQNVWSVVTSFFATIWNTIAGIFEVVADVFRGDFSGAWDAIKGIVSQWGNFFKGVWDAIVNIFNAVVGFFTGIFSRAWSGICSAFNNVGSFFGGVISSIANVFTSLPGKAISWGKDMIQGFIDGIKNMIGNVGKAVSGIADKVKSFLHFSRPDTGPLRDYEAWMPDFVSGLASGISDNAYKVTDAVKEMASGMSINTAVSGSLTASESSANSIGSVGVSGLLSSAVNNSNSNSQNLTVNVYPSEGMDEKKLAEYTIDEINKQTNCQKVVFE